MRKVKLSDHVAELVRHHGGYRKAARALLIDAGYLHRLASGTKRNPNQTILRKLWLTQVVTTEYFKPAVPAKRRQGAGT